jgi:hypothetical protein
VNRSYLRYFGVTVAAVLTFVIASAGPAAAKPPGWGFTNVTAVPGSVSPGKAVAFNVTIKNDGRSNISSVLMATDLAASNPLAVPLAVWDVQWTGQPAPLVMEPCGTGPFTSALSCDFGSLVSGASVSLKIAFTTPSTGSSWAFNFVLTGNGNTPSDTGGTSHGDTKKGPASVTLNSSPDFAGGFVVDSDSFGTLVSLTKQNPQAATLSTSQDLQPTTLQEGNTYSGAGDLCSTVNCIGQWATITAPNPDGDLISGSLLIFGKGIPGSVGPEDILLYHLDGSGDDGIIGDQADERCASATDAASAPCIFVTEVGQNFRIDFWLLHNGTLRGTW